MKRLALAIGASVIAAACSSSSPAGPGPIAAGSTSTADAKPSTGVPMNWVAHLGGDNEVPANPSKGQGQAIFKLSEDGDTISYRLISSNIENIVQAHIHVVTATGDPTTLNGPISVFLYGLVAPGGGRHNGVLAEGEFSTSNLTNQATTGVSTLAQLVAAMDAGKTYVNVHTSKDAISGSTGVPGDIPGGEIRGQISPAGH
jgi:hypothetical protein